MHHLAKGFQNLSIASVFLLLIACGTEKGAQLANQETETQPTIVIMGGNGSCGTDTSGRENSPYAMGMYGKMLELVNDLKGSLGIEPKTLVSCYPFNDDLLAFAKSDNPERVYRNHRAVFTRFLQAYADEDEPLVIAGHSYGGWLGMKTAIAVAQQREFTSLISIDPISKVECSFQRPFGCQRAPRDMPDDQLELIVEQSSEWTNLYQTRTLYLHSSEIEQADNNEWLGTNHSGIALHARTWNSIRATFESYY